MSACEKCDMPLIGSWCRMCGGWTDEQIETMAGYMKPSRPIGPFGTYMDPQAFVTIGDLSATKVAAHIPITGDIATEWKTNTVTFRAEDLMDRILHPWKYPDLPAMPEIVLFPRLIRVADRARLLRRRLRETIDVARHGLPPEREDDW